MSSGRHQGLLTQFGSFRVSCVLASSSVVRDVHSFLHLRVALASVGFAEEYLNAKAMLQEGRSNHVVLDQFMSARSELIKLANSGKLPLKARSSKLADLQEQLQTARQRVIEVYKMCENLHRTKYRAMTVRSVASTRAAFHRSNSNFRIGPAAHYGLSDSHLCQSGSS